MGKTHLLLEFGNQVYANTFHFNFETTPELKECFERSLEPATIISKLEIFAEKKIDSRSALIFFDEIQLCAKALTSLKYFCEDANQYQIVCAGSSLGITLASGGSFPVGKVNFLNIYPLSFSEFLSALGKEKLLDYLHSIDLPDQTTAFHQELIELYRHHTFLGGMPEVVQRYLDTRDFSAAREVQQEIVRAYEQDFSKYWSPAEALKIKRIWDSIPAQLARENKKFIFSAVAKSARAREYEVALQSLVDAGVILRSKLCRSGKPPLAASATNDSFKIFSLDTGLLGAIVNLPQALLLRKNELYVQFQGAFFENQVAAAITTALQRPLYYWTSNLTAEVDFLTEYEGEVVPLEAKSGESLRSKSLSSYLKKYDPRIALRISHRPLAKNGKILEFPIYLLDELPRILKSQLS